MKQLNSFWLASLMLQGGLIAHAGSPVTLARVEVPVRFVDYAFAVSTGDDGVPRMDWKRFSSRSRRVVTQSWGGIQLQNDDITVVLIPSRGRVHSFVNRHTGREQLWINPCAVPLGAKNDTGFWMTWGGIEHVLPRREHGTSHALNWQHRIVCESAHCVRICCSTVEPLTKLQHELHWSLSAGKPYLETTVVIRNPSANPVRYSHWTTSVLAPGGVGEVTPNTELIVPAEQFIPDERDFNAWMSSLPFDARNSPLRMVKNWTSMGDLMTSRLHRPYYAVYSHERDEGVVHLFDLSRSGVIDIWSWGYPATAELQKEFTAAPPNRGYIELWNGNVKDFRDESLRVIESGETVCWAERTFCIHGILSRQNDLRTVIGQQASRHEVTTTHRAGDLD